MVVDHVAVGIGDLLDQVRRGKDPPVGQRPIGAGQVEHVHADRPQGERGDGHLIGLLRIPFEAEPFRHVDHVVSADQLL